MQNKRMKLSEVAIYSCTLASPQTTRKASRSRKSPESYTNRKCSVIFGLIYSFLTLTLGQLTSRP